MKVVLDVPSVHHITASHIKVLNTPLHKPHILPKHAHLILKPQPRPQSCAANINVSYAACQTV